jgi:hypothetical protein
MRIPVYDHDYRPDRDEPDWRPRWEPEDPDGGWSADLGTFRFSPRSGRGTPTAASDDLFWIGYRHWIRGGGSHRTSVPLAKWPEGVRESASRNPNLKYDTSAGALEAIGAMPRDLRDELLLATTGAASRDAIESLYERSHFPPITDVYGYNRGADGGGAEEIRDLMIECRVVVYDATGRFALELSDGTETLRCLFDFDERNVRLLDTRTGKMVRSATVPPAMLSGVATVEMSLMDRQALVTVAGKTLFEPWSYPDGVDRGPAPTRPVRIGVTRREASGTREV